MHTSRQQQLIDALTSYDLQGVSFADAKDELLTQGFTDIEISQAIYSAPFDGRDNRVRRTPSADEQALAKHPDLAQKLGNSWTRDKTRNEFHKAATLYAASTLLPGRMGAHYELQAADQLGVPYFRFLFLALLFTIPAVIYEWPADYLRYANIGFALLFNGLLIGALYRKWRLYRRHDQ